MHKSRKAEINIDIVFRFFLFFFVLEDCCSTDIILLSQKYLNHVCMKKFSNTITLRLLIASNNHFTLSEAHRNLLISFKLFCFLIIKFFSIWIPLKCWFFILSSCFDWMLTFHLHAARGVHVAWVLRNPKPLHTVVYSYKQKSASISTNHTLNFIFLDKYDSKFVVHWLFIAEEELLVSRLVHVLVFHDSKDIFSWKFMVFF